MSQLPPIAAWVEVPASWGDPPRRFVFGKPAEVWEARTLDRVRPALERVAAAQRDGLYVIGFLTYESAPAFDPALRTPPPGDLPLAWFAAYEKPQSSNVKLQIPDSPVQVSRFTFHVSEDEYIACVNRSLDHIRAGNIYQVNYTVRSELDVTDPLALFQTLLAAAPMPHAAYLDVLTPAAHGDARGILDSNGYLISLSPELFLRKRGKVLESRPMKGTARREPSWMADEAARVALSRDEKNRAENVMIVDLVRNDLGRICKMGSVTVPELWRVDRFPTVHQMTSLVRGEVRDDVSLFDIFAALFPPGSVTGAPKIRATEIISELEPEPRGIYCGTIGIFFPSGDFECNVAIRTLQGMRGEGGGMKAVLGLGSGIVADSDPETEWQETQLKGEFVSLRPQEFSIYETIRYEPRGGYGDLHLHLRRLRQSCLYFNRTFPLSEIISHLRSLTPELGDRPARIKLDLGLFPLDFSVAAWQRFRVSTSVIHENLGWPEGGMTVMLSDLPLDPADFRLYHKTNLRPEKYAELEKARALGATEVLFLNTRGELCEGALSNVALKIGGQWLTPASHCGLLPGTWREKQLASGRLREAVLTAEDLYRAEEIRLGNAVRGEGRVASIITCAGKRLT